MTVWVVTTEIEPVLAVLSDPSQLQECLRSYFWQRNIDDRAEDAALGRDNEPWLVWAGYESGDLGDGVADWAIYYEQDPTSPAKIEDRPYDRWPWQTGTLTSMEIWP